MTRADRDDLVAALSLAGSRDPALANAIATELLNRLRRGPYVGAAFALSAAFLAVVATNWIDTGRLLLVESGVRAALLDLLVLTLATGVIVMYLAYRGRVTALRGWGRAGRRW